VVRIISARKATPAYPVVSANRNSSKRGFKLGPTYSALLKQADKEKATRREVRFYE
jgi:hypothetical protein